MDEKYTRVFRVSIFEYVKRGIIALIICSVPAAIGGYGWIVVALLIALLLVGYARLYSLRLYLDEMGVNCYDGIMPWSRGTSSIGWQDFGGAAYKTGFFSYVFKSYTLTINHRFTNTSNIVVASVARGNEFVELANEYLARLHSGDSQDRANKIKH